MSGTDGKGLICHSKIFKTFYKIKFMYYKCIKFGIHQRGPHKGFIATGVHHHGKNVTEQ